MKKTKKKQQPMHQQVDKPVDLSSIEEAIKAKTMKKLGKPHNFFKIDELFEINTTISNTNYNKKNLEIELFIDNINVGKNVINTVSGKKNNIVFKSTIPGNDIYNGYVKIVESNDIIDDNKFFFSINTDSKYNICLVSDNNEDFYVRSALEAQMNFHNDISLHRYNSTDYLYNDFPFFDTIIFFDANQLNMSTYDKLSSQTSNLLIIPSSETISANFLNEIDDVLAPI